MCDAVCEALLLRTFSPKQSSAELFRTLFCARPKNDSRAKPTCTVCLRCRRPCCSRTRPSPSCPRTSSSCAFAIRRSATVSASTRWVAAERSRARQRSSITLSVGARSGFASERMFCIRLLKIGSLFRFRRVFTKVEYHLFDVS